MQQKMIKIGNKKIILCLLMSIMIAGCLQACTHSNDLSACYIDIRVYGAKGDGISDDTVAIQAALNDVDSNGGVVFFPAGEYVITSGLKINHKKDIKIRGTGKESHIKADKPFFDMITILSSSDISIEYLFFEGVSVAAIEGSGYSAVIVIDSSRTLINKCIFSKINNGVVIPAPGNKDCIVSENIFLSLVGGTSGNGYGVYTASERTIITNNIFQNIPRHDVYLSGKYADYGARFCVVTGNISYGNQGEAIAVYATGVQRAARDNIIRGNMFIDAIGDRVIGLTQNSISNVIEGNTFYNSSGVSIFCEGSTTDNTYPDKNIILGNMIYGSGSKLGSIRIVNGSYNLLEGNQLFNPGSHGILLNTTGSPSVIPTGNVIRNNIVKGAEISNITSVISDTSISGNITD